MCTTNADTPADVLREFARQFEWVNFEEADVGYCDPDKAVWHYDPAYDVTKLDCPPPAVGWDAWLKEEVEITTPGWYSFVDGAPITECIVIFEHEGRGYVWDGWHRTAFARIKGIKTLRAIVGTRI